MNRGWEGGNRGPFPFLTDSGKIGKSVPGPEEECSILTES